MDYRMRTTRRRTARNAPISPAIVGLARLGYAVKGVVYMVIGFLTILLLSGHGGQITDQNGALKAIYNSPLGSDFGHFLLVVITIGLFGFALWSLLQGLLDTERKGQRAKGILARVGYVIVAISYGLLGLVAYQIASTGSASTSRNSTSTVQNWTGTLLAQPKGVLLVVLVGVIILCVGGHFIHKAAQATFMRHLDLSGLSASGRRGVRRTGSFGYLALAVVFMIIGIFLIVAALQHNPGDAKGLDSALIELLKQPFGPWVLGIVALGLIAYGVYSFVEARYRKVGWR